jgi:hypothetical protein
VTYLGNWYNVVAWTQAPSDWDYNWDVGVWQYDATMANKWLNLFYMNEPGIVDSINLYVRGITGNSNHILPTWSLIYNVVQENVNHTPASLVHQGGQINIHGAWPEGWVGWGVPSIYFPAGHYWLGFFAGGYQYSVRCYQIAETNTPTQTPIRYSCADNPNDGPVNPWYSSYPYFRNDSEALLVFLNYTPTTVNASIAAPVALGNASRGVPTVVQGVVVNAAAAATARGIAPPTVTGQKTVAMVAGQASAVAPAPAARSSRKAMIIYPLDNFPFRLELVEDP